MGKSPDAFRTISEVADWLDTQAHVLRFWESKFTQVKPVKRAGGRRYYRPADMLLLGGIKKLLHDDGMTIKGAQKLLREKGTKYVSGLSQPLEGHTESDIQEAEIDLVEVSPQEEERGTVLSFERPETTPAVEEDASHTDGMAEAKSPPAPQQDDQDGDLFSLAGEEIPATEPDRTSTEDTAAEDMPLADTEDTPAPQETDPETVPSFVQRLTPKPATGEDTADTEAKQTEQPPQPSETKGDIPDSPDTEQADPDADDPHEPGLSLLADIATMTGIAAENHTETAALLDRLAALAERIETAENA